MAVAAIGLAIFLDAAVETFRAGSPVRWWVCGAAVVYVIATAATWRSTIGWRGRFAIAGIGLSVLVAVTAWVPAGLSDGIRLAGQPTARVLASFAAAGVVVAGLAAIRLRILPLPIKVVLGVIAAYGGAAFLLGAISGTPFAALLGGESMWRRLPTFLQGAFVGGLVVLPVGFVAAVVKAGLRRPAAASLRAEVWKIAAMAASLGIVLAGLPVRSTQTTAPPASSDPQTLAARLGIDPGAPRPSAAALDAALANSLKAIEDGEREAPRDRWDPAFVATALDSDPQRIFAWVQANTFWIPYRGLLRGADGVLMDRLGNSLDRAALLATLLRESGRTTRLARGTLPVEAAAELVRRQAIARTTSAHRPLAAQPTDQVSVVAAQYLLDDLPIRRTLAMQADDATRKRGLLLERVPDQTQRLAAAAGLRSGAPSEAAFESALDAARDHWWVQMLEEGQWRDLDPASPAIGTAAASAEETIELDAFPDDQRQLITIRVIAEQWTNGALREHVALEHVLRPSRLLGVPIVLQFNPSKLPPAFPPANTTPEQALRSLALNQHEWIPALVVGKEQVVQKSIRNTGDVARPRTPIEEVGGATAGKMGSLTRALDDALGPAPPSSKPPVSNLLTATWVEYDIQAPGEQPRKIRRALFDLVGAAARASGAGGPTPPALDDGARLTRSLALIQQIEILPVVCRVAPEYVTHLTAQALLANRNLLQSLVRGDVPDDFAHAQEIAGSMSRIPTRLYGLALARFEWSRFADQMFIGEPNILTRHTFFAPSSQTFTLVDATDIVTNGVEVEFHAEDPVAIRMEQGVLDTNAEAILASERPNGSNAAWAFGDAAKWTVVRDPADPQWAALRLPDDVRQLIAGDLAAGYVVVAPKAPVAVAGDTFTGWWRIDPVTGDTLGFGSTGWGSEFVEYLITNALISFMFGFILCTLTSPTPIPQQGPGCVYAGLMSVLIQVLLDLLLAGLVVGALSAFRPRPSSPLGDLPFAKTQPGLPPPKPPMPEPAPAPAPGPTPNPGPGPNPGPWPGPGPSPNPTPAPTPPAGGPGSAPRSGGPGPGWLNWGESWPGPFSGGSWPKTTPAPAPPYTPARPPYSPPRPSPNQPAPVDYSNKPGFLQWGERVGGGRSGSATPPTQPGGTVNAGPPGPGGTLPAGQPGPGGTLPCSPGIPCPTTGVVKVHLGIGGAINTLGQKGGG